MATTILRKQTYVEIIPEVLPVPYQPAYTVVERIGGNSPAKFNYATGIGLASGGSGGGSNRTVPYSGSGGVRNLGLENGADPRSTWGAAPPAGSSSSSYTPPRTVTTHYPAVPAVVGVAAQIIVDYHEGWDNVAALPNILHGAGYFQCRIPAIVSGVTIGVSSDYDVVPFQFRINNRRYELLENGLPIGGGVAPDEAEYKISRDRSGAVAYYVDNVLVGVATGKSIGPVQVVASLYAGQDVIYDAFLRSTEPAFVFDGAPSIIFLAPAQPAAARMSEVARTEFFAVASAPTARMGKWAIPGQIYAPILPAAAVFSQAAIYAALRAACLPPTCVFGRVYTPTPKYWFVASPHVLCEMGNTEKFYLKDSAEGNSFRPAAALFSGRDSTEDVRGYAEFVIDTPFLKPRVYFDDGFGEGEYTMFIGLRAFAKTIPFVEAVANIYGRMGAAVALTLDMLLPDVDIEMSAAARGAITLYELLEELISAEARFIPMRDDGDLLDLQFAVNQANGALTTYRNFGFAGFSRAENNTYAIRDDGLYILRAGDDDGAPYDATIDFGLDDFSTVARKNVDSLYLGLGTNGVVYARLRDELGDEHTYTVSQTTPTARAICGRGKQARSWGLRLDIIDAVGMELDTVEFSINIAVRRRMP